MAEKIFYKNGSRGFTLIELLMSLSLGLMIIGGIYSVSNSQQRIYSVQDQITLMHQKARIVMDTMTRELRMAGYDPTLSGYTVFGDGAGNNVNGTTLQFAVDWDGDGIDLVNDADESITYSLNGTDLIRTTNTSPQGEVLVDDLVSIAFSYDLTADSAGVDGIFGGQSYGIGDDDDCDGTVDNAGEMLTLPTVNCMAPLNAYYPKSTELRYIRSIRIALTLRTSQPDPSYTNPDGVNGNYRTVQLVSRVNPRNLGI